MTGNEIGMVAACWRYPVSSLAGEPVRSVDLLPNGAQGDRLFGVVDAASGDIARPLEDRWKPVPNVAARLTSGGALEIAVPDGSWLPAPGEAAEHALSDFLGFDAAIRPLSDSEPETPDHQLAQARYVKAPIHLLTTASLARLKTLHPEGNIDARRFRPNILVDMAEMPGRFPETEWIGRKLVIGDAILTIAEPCRRCGFTILEQEDLDHDPEILRQIVRHNAHNMGIYCSVERPGRMAVGDPVVWA